MTQNVAPGLGDWARNGDFGCNLYYQEFEKVHRYFYTLYMHSPLIQFRLFFEHYTSKHNLTMGGQQKDAQGRIRTRVAGEGEFRGGAKRTTPGIPTWSPTVVLTRLDDA